MRISISFLLVIAMAVQSIADQNLIESTCKRTQNYQLCIATLTADPVSPAADVAGLSLIMIGAVESKTKETLSAVNKLAGNRQAVDKCNSVYKAVLGGDIPTARSAVKGNPKFAEGGMADAVVEAEICEAAFGGNSPVSDLNKAVGDLAAVARAIIRNLL